MLWQSFRLIPSVRYYTQSQADFYAPFYQNEQSDGLYSSDYRLSPFGALTWRVKGETRFQIYNLDLIANIAYERYMSSGNLAIKDVSVSNPGPGRLRDVLGRTHDEVLAVERFRLPLPGDGEPVRAAPRRRRTATPRSACFAAVAAEVARLEQKYSRYRDDSLTSRINRSAGDARASRSTPRRRRCSTTRRRPSPRATAASTSPRASCAAPGTSARAGCPRARRVAALLPLVGWQHVRWQRPRLVLPRPGMQLDFGGLREGVRGGPRRGAVPAPRRAARSSTSAATSPIVGPHPDGRPWRVGVRDPFGTRRASLTLAVYAGGVATSGDTERCMVVDGRRYGHILDPRTGWPVEGPAAVTVLADRCLVAGTASTIAMLRGRGAGPAWLAAERIPHVGVDRDGTLRVAVRAAPRGAPPRRARLELRHALGDPRPASAAGRRLPPMRAPRCRHARPCA